MTAGPGDAKASRLFIGIDGACIAWVGEPGVDAETIAGVAGLFLETASAPGSDPGLAIGVAGNSSDPRSRRELVEFGHRAKGEVLDRSEALALAGSWGVSLSAHGGDGGGIIGALAAVGLRLGGENGRFLWMPGLRALAGPITRLTSARSMSRPAPFQLDPAAP